jgi:hypothetical protein
LHGAQDIGVADSGVKLGISPTYLIENEWLRITDTVNIYAELTDLQNL